MTHEDFKPGDLLTLYRKDGKKVKAKVELVNYRGNGLVSYSGTDCGQGSFDPKDFSSRFQPIERVKIVGWERPHRPFIPRPRDLGYDLIH